jgi:hypothetical protein
MANEPAARCSRCQATDGPFSRNEAGFRVCSDTGACLARTSSKGNTAIYMMFEGRLREFHLAARASRGRR